MTARADSTPDATLDRIEGRLAAARSALEAGALANLEGLETDVAALRDLAADLPEGSGTRLRPRLLSVLDEIDQLAAELRGGLDQLGRELGDNGKRRQAVSAYARSQPPQPKGRR